MSPVGCREEWLHSINGLLQCPELHEGWGRKERAKILLIFWTRWTKKDDSKIKEKTFIAPPLLHHHLTKIWRGIQKRGPVFGRFARWHTNSLNEGVVSRPPSWKLGIRTEWNGDGSCGFLYRNMNMILYDMIWYDMIWFDVVMFYICSIYQLAMTLCSTICCHLSPQLNDVAEGYSMSYIEANKCGCLEPNAIRLCFFSNLKRCVFFEYLQRVSNGRSKELRIWAPK